MNKRLIALLLCISMLLPLFTGAVPVVHAEESSGENQTVYHANIGRKAKFNPTYIQYGTFPVSDAPETEQSYFVATQMIGSDVSEDLIVVITDVYVNTAQNIYWYKIVAEEGYTLPALMITEPWVFQNDIGGSDETGSLLLLAEEPDPTEPETTEPDPTEPETTEPETTEPDPTEPDPTEPASCPICGQIGCTSLHFYCDICGKYDCGLSHLYCYVCEKYDCGLSHIYCNICDAYDCGQEHEDIFKPITTPVIPENPTLTDGAAVSVVDGNGDPVEDFGIVMEEGTKISLSAWSALEGEVSYQWQIRYDAYNDLWVNIHGQTGKGILISPAMFQSLGDDAAIRCVISSGGISEMSEAIPLAVMQPIAPMSLSRSADSEGDTEGDDEGSLEKAYIVVEYQYKDGRTAAQSAIAEVTPGTAVNPEGGYPLPVIQGYQATLAANSYATIETIDGNQVMVVNIPGEDVHGTVRFVVTYLPTSVSYKVIHYQQNVNDNGYTKVAEEDGTALTGEIIKDVHKTYTGFYNLIYETPTAAADGSTVIEVYYDRLYYLLLFELDGGYGVDPIFARYESAVEVGTPTRYGYDFKGWTQFPSSTTAVSLPETVPAENRTYYAIWTVQGRDVKYTVVYWKENPNDNGYSYWAQKTESARTGDIVSGGDNVGSLVGDEQYFTFNEALTDKNVVVSGDGTTVVNVYYTRNYYTLIFYYDGDCQIEEHTHGASCVRDLICGSVDHEHDASCMKTLVCTKTEHTHGTDCNCNVSEHTAHTDECYTCTVHTSHSKSCWADVGNNSSYVNNAPSNPANGYVYQSRWGMYTYTYIYINGSWYTYTGTTTNGNIAPTICHTHGDGNCTYKDTLHTHGDGNCEYDHLAHTHEDACYTYQCGQDEHEHTALFTL